MGWRSFMTWLPRGAFLTGLLLGLVGCQEADEEVREYRVPRPVGRLTYTLPPGWEKWVAVGPVPAEAAFRVVDKGVSADISVTALPGAAGGLVPNVNRWRGQIQLDHADEPEVRKGLKPTTVGGQDGYLVDLIGPDNAGPKRQRIVGAILTRGNATWFFKMRGPVELVGQQIANFETFLRSVQFTDSQGGPHG